MSYNMPHNRAKLLLHTKDEFADQAIVEMKVWSVPSSPRTPDGFKYSLVYIDGGGRRVLGYDNAEGKGHHRHEGDEETPVRFEGVDSLIGRFLDEVRELRRRP